jgi:hypothetical protein
VRRALAIVVAVAVLIVPGTADAGVRYASPAGGVVPGCAQATPCSLEYAITAAAPNDEVIVTYGSYPVGVPIVATVPLTIRGETLDPAPPGGRRPQVLGAPSVTPLESTARLTISDLTMTSNEAGLGTLFAVGNGSVFERLELVAFGEGVAALRPGNSFTVTDSLLRGTGEFAGGLFLQGTETGLGVVRNSTLIGSGPGSTGLAVFTALAGATSTIQAVNTIADGATDVSATAAPGAGVAIALDHSNFDTSTGPVTATAGQTAAPLFEDAAAGNFRQASGSPTIDAGVSDPANGTTDLDGNDRDYGGGGFAGCGVPARPPVTDIGAYEEIYAIAVPMVICKKPRGGRPDTKITKAKIRKRKGTAKFRFRATVPGSSFECRLVKAKRRKGAGASAKRKRFRRCASPKRFRNLKPGRYRFSVRAVNSSGADPTPASRRFRIP